MRETFLVVATLLLVSPVAADPYRAPKPAASANPAKTLPLKRATSGNSCAAYGPGFVKIDGTDTCMKIGGAVSVGVGGSSR
jgi:hypothetical protein